MGRGRRPVEPSELSPPPSRFPSMRLLQHEAGRGAMAVGNDRAHPSGGSVRRRAAHGDKGYCRQETTIARSTGAGTVLGSNDVAPLIGGAPISPHIEAADAKQ